MSSIGSPIDTSLLQAAQAQQTAAKARDKERATTETGRRRQDLVDFRVAGVEETDAARHLPHSDSEEADQEPDHAAHRPPDEGDAPHVDVQA